MRSLVRATIFGFRLAPLLLAVYWVLLFTGTHLPGSTLRHMRFNDKLLHFSAYAGLAFLVAWAIPKRIAGYSGLLIAAAIVIAYAAIDELTQGFVPRRRPDLDDFIADLLGMACGFIIYKLLRLFIVGKAPSARESAWASSQHKSSSLQKSPSQ